MSYVIDARSYPSGTDPASDADPASGTQSPPAFLPLCQKFEHKKLCRVSYGPRIYQPPDVCGSLMADSGSDAYPAAEPPWTDRPGAGGRRRLETVDSDSFSSFDCDEVGGGKSIEFVQDPAPASGGFIVRSAGPARIGHSPVPGDNAASLFLYSQCANRTAAPDAVDSRSGAASDFRSVFSEDPNAQEFSKLSLRDSGYSSNSLPLNDLPTAIAFDSATVILDPATMTAPAPPPDYERLKEFALKLGYSEQQLRAVLQRLELGYDAFSLVGQDKILAELIKLGQDACNGVKTIAAYDDVASSLPTAAKLRAVVVDGSNVAMTHGHKEVYSCKGIKECVDFFKRRGHSDIKVFVPHFRKEASRSDAPITDQNVLFELEQQGVLIWTPSRRLNGRRIVCHDDRYIVKTASDKDAVIVSNDEYRDIVKENPEYRRVVEERLLMYSFVDGKFMPPDDPLGRYGPKLDQFLRKGPSNMLAALCPYGRKCTYGNKCKFSHPERPNGLHRSVTDRLKDRAELHRRISPSNSLQIQQSESKQTTSPHSTAVRSHSFTNPHYNNYSDYHNVRSHYPHRRQRTLQLENKSKSPFCNEKCVAYCSFDGYSNSHVPVTMSHSAETTTSCDWFAGADNKESLCKQFSYPEYPKESHFRTAYSQIQSNHCQNAVSQNRYLAPPPDAPHFWQHSNNQNHPSVARNLSAPGVPIPPTTCCRSQQAPAAPFDPHFNAFYAVNSGQNNDPNRPPTQTRKNSVSDSQLNLLGHKADAGAGPDGANAVFDYGSDSDFNGSGAVFNASGAVFNASGGVFNGSGTVFGTPAFNGPNSTADTVGLSLDHTVGQQRDDPWYVPSPTVWGPLENSCVPLLVGGGSANAWNHCSTVAVPEPSPGSDYCSHSATRWVDNQRRRLLFYHLSKLFPYDIVDRVMRANEGECDPHRLCQLILAENNPVDH